MNSIVSYNCQQGSDEWFDLRCGRITGSKFSALMAGQSTKTYKDLIYTVVGEIISGSSEPGYQNDHMIRGTELEPEARSFYEEVNGISVSEIGFITNEDMHPEYFGVSPDGIVGDGLIEIKCPMMKTHIGYLEAKKLPNEYKWQVQGQMLITGAEWCDFVSYYPAIKMLIVRVDADKEMQQAMIGRMEQAINDIQTVLKKL